MANEYYPPLSSLLPLEALPDSLGFVKDGITSLLDGLYFKDLQYSISVRGDAAQYSLTIVRSKAIEIEIPGTGMFLMLNPGTTSVPRPEFPVTLRYEWGILAWLRQFDLETFSFQPADFYQLALTALGLTERQLLERALNAFFPNLNLLDQVDQFVTDVNTLHGTTLGPFTGPDALGDALAAVTTAVNLEASVLAFALYVQDDLDLAHTEERLEVFFAGLFPGSLKDYFLKLITPRIDATLHIGFGIRFPRTMLQPLPDTSGNTPAYSQLAFDAGQFSFSTESGIGYDQKITASFTPSRIGDTGFTIEFNGARLDLSRTSNIPEATADGRSDEFVGVFVESATIGLPSFFNQDKSGSSAQIIGKNLLIGTGGGISGTLALQAKSLTSTTPALIKAKFGGGFELGLSAVSVSFKQNAITGSEIRGFMKIPGFKDAAGNEAEIQIKVSIGNDGNFSVTASEDQGIRALSIPDVLDFVIDSVSVGRKNGRFFVAVSGEIDFGKGAIGKFLQEKIDIRKLLIWDDGKIELEGGKITLPRAVSLKVGPVNLSVTAIGYGSHEQEHDGHLRQYSYVTFDGGISVKPGGVDVSGSGIAFYYTVDNEKTGLAPHRFLRIQSIAIDLVIPGSASKESAVLLLKGYLSMVPAKPPASGTEYAGAITFRLPKLKMGGSAAMRLNPNVPAFIVDVSLEIATPILLGSTGLGIWGFRALFGQRYVASRQEIGLLETDPWWKYYKAKIAPDNREGIQISKFAQTAGFSFGAGASIATSSDKGVTFASKLFLLLSLPEVFLLQGQAQILKGLIQLTDTTDPPFFALISITKNSVETAFGLKYLIPAEGDEPGGIATVEALIEMGFFWGNSTSWYVNIGRETPATDRVRVRLLKIIDAYFYFMMSGSGIRADAGASYELKKKFGPLKAELRAYLDTAGRLSRRPSRIGASIRIGGTVDLSIFGFGFGISAAASLAAEGTKPFTITGSLEVCVRVLRKNRCAKFEFTWIFNTAIDTTETKLLDDDLSKAARALNIHTQETYALWTGGSLPSPAALDAFMIPMDSFIDVAFTKGVKPSPAVVNAFGGNTMGSQYVEYFAPQRGKTDRVRHEYVLDNVEVLYHDGTTWRPYDIYAAATPAKLKPFITSDLTKLKQGFWQYQDPDRHNKLRILAQSPLTYASQGSGDLVVEDSGITAESIFCAPDPIAETCVSFDDFPPVVNAPVLLAEDRQYFHRRFQFRVVGSDGHVVPQPIVSHGRGVRLPANSSLEIFLIEPAVSVRLQLLPDTDNAVVRFYRRVPVPQPRPGLPETKYDYVQIATKNVTGASVTEVRYQDLAHPVDKIVIEAGDCNIEPPLVCDPALTPQALDLAKFLQALVTRGDLLKVGIDLCERHCEAWNGIFFNTSLYGAPADPVYFRYSLLTFTQNELHGRITDWRGFGCTIDLVLIEGAAAIDWTLVTSLHDLRADFPPVPGTNYTFLIDADVQTPIGLKRVTLRGKSCYPITHCAIPGNDPGQPTQEALALCELLPRLSEKNRLVQPRVRLLPDELALFDRILPTPTGAPRTTKVWLTTNEQPGPRLDIAWSDGIVGAEVSLTLPNARVGFRFDDVIGFSGIRADRSRPVAGPIRGFLIDAHTRKGDVVTLRVDTSFTAFTTTAVPTAEARVTFWTGGVQRLCALYLYEVCLLDYPSAAFNATLPTQTSVDAEVHSIINAFQGSIQPLWRPNTHYAIRITTRDDVFRESESSTAASHPPRQHVFGFRTVGPLGHFHIYPDAAGNPVARDDYDKLEKADRGDEFKLTGLLHYIDFDKSYPNADGQLINAKPLFYDKPRLLLFYLQTYVARMFCDWAPYGALEGANAVFEVLVKDPAPDPNVPEAGAIETTWEISPIPIVSQDITILNNIIKHGTPCGSVTEIKPTWLNSAFPLESAKLRPSKLYTAIFSLRFKKTSDTKFVRRELLRYCFQTSSYANLGEQLAAHMMFEAGREFTADDLAAAESVLNDSMAADDPLRQKFGDPFNRLIDGALRMEATHPPDGAEFNIVRDTTSGRVLGILFKSPEPINDPKIPAADVLDTIRLAVNGGSTADFKSLYSKDLAQAFVTNADNSMNLPAGATLAFTFDFKQWDGSQYKSVDTAHVTLVLP